jgi:hypothetical protein
MAQARAISWIDPSGAVGKAARKRSRSAAWRSSLNDMA